MKFENKTKHCPYCDSISLLYEIDIFTQKYKDNIKCKDCKGKFTHKEIKEKFWKEVRKR